MTAKAHIVRQGQAGRRSHSYAVVRQFASDSGISSFQLHAKLKSRIQLVNKADRQSMCIASIMRKDITEANLNLFDSSYLPGLRLYFRYNPDEIARYCM